MGVTGGLVRSIFFRNKSFGTHDYNKNNGRSNVGEKKRWSSVRSYLCGDEFNSVVAVNDSGSIKDSEALLTMSQQLSSDLVRPFDSVVATEDSASVKHLEAEDSVSVKSSEATVTQPLRNIYVREDFDNQSEGTETHIPKKHQTTPISNLFIQEDAAIIIQKAFRTYLVKRCSKEVEEESQSNVSMGTSLEVQTGNSVKAPFLGRKRVSKKNTNQVLRIKEDWDDSTVSTTISKSRIQSRIEAMTKRERALAYAFSQQLRICSKKKQIDRSSEDDSNIGWSWLERWMATRVPDSIPVESKTNIHTEFATKTQKLLIKNRSFGLAGELESCASNDIPLQFETISETFEEEETKDLQTEKITSNISKRKSVTSYKSQRRHNRLQATKRDLQQHTKKAKKAKTTPTSCKSGNECEAASHKSCSST